jgi:hypothetical protein
MGHGKKLVPDRADREDRGIVQSHMQVACRALPFPCMKAGNADLTEIISFTIFEINAEGISNYQSLAKKIMQSEFPAIDSNP